jgi:glucokinase
VTGREVIVGIDLGGTGTRIVAVDATGTMAGQKTVPTKSMGVSGNPEQAVRDLAEHVLTTAERGSLITAAGIGATGPVGMDGIIRNDDTLPGFSHVPVAGMLGRLLGVACVIDNDAVTAAVGEYARGAGRGATPLLVVMLGTGVGVCLLRHGRPYRGGDGLHPEAGHLPTPGPPAPCYCGLPSCWEQKASRAALELACQALLAPENTTGPPAPPWESVNIVADRAANGDRGARELFRRYGNDVGQGIGALATTFRPSRVIIGGSASGHIALFLAGMREALGRRPPFEVTADLRSAALGDLAGAIGAAELARKQ